ncbi:MAG: amidohydrolase family protein [Dehalococcoidia bacterium]|nr:amidohydrolase family protein [Dehalococcoidia bacterium]
MIIDCHGHYTTAPAALFAYRRQQLADLASSGKAPPKGTISISDDEIRESVEKNQIRLQRERGSDLTFFSPQASAMAHHEGDETANRYWAEHCNDLIHRVATLYPSNFVGACMLPQVPGISPANCIAELRRCVTELGMIAANLNPDPSGGYWTDPPLTDHYWYPIFEAASELDVPLMVHVSTSCNPNFHTTGSHYLNADTSAFVQLLMSDLFKDFPTLKLIIPHGGGAVPYHWGRFRGLAQDNGWKSPAELMGNNVFFDTCVYHKPGIEVLLKVVPEDNILFASEMVGAVRGVDPDTGFNYDDTKRYIDAVDWLNDAQRQKIYEGNARRVYSRFRS